MYAAIKQIITLSSYHVGPTSDSLTSKVKSWHGLFCVHKTGNA